MVMAIGDGDGDGDGFRLNDCENVKTIEIHVVLDVLYFVESDCDVSVILDTLCEF